MHHGDGDADRVAQAISTTAAMLRVGNSLGPTGRFPGGKLLETDKGEVNFEVVRFKNKVIVNFGTSLMYIGMSPREARRFASLLIQKANAITEPPKRRRGKRGKRGQGGNGG